jgi:hypothetical protein
VGEEGQRKALGTCGTGTAVGTGQLRVRHRMVKAQGNGGHGSFVPQDCGRHRLVVWARVICDTGTQDNGKHRSVLGMGK